MQRPTHEPFQKEVSFIYNMQITIELQRIKDASLQDPMLNLLKKTVYKVWPPLRKTCPHELWEHWNFRCDLVIDDGLVLKGD